MASSSSGSRCIAMDLHHNGVFVKRPFDYKFGKVKTLINVDLSKLEYHEVIEFFEKESNTPISGIYFCVPGKELPNGLRLVKCDIDVSRLVKYGLQCVGKIAVYLDHFEEDLSEYIGEDEEQIGVGDNNDERSSDETFQIANEGVDDDDDVASLDHLSDGEDEVMEYRMRKDIPMQNIQPSRVRGSHTNGDDDSDEDQHEKYLNDLYASLHMDDNNDNIVNSEEENTEEDIDGPTHDPTTRWKLMKPRVAERYANPQQLKECILNYALANGYPIWYERIDHKKICAKCGSKKQGKDGQPICPWRLWATWMKSERSFQVKTIHDEHQCVRNFKFASLVTYKVIANKFGDKIRSNPKIKLRELQAAMLKKYRY